MATVLVVEDDADTRELVSRYLTYMGHRAIAATNGHDALAMLEAQPADLILLDMMMPTMDGATVLRAIRCGCPPVIVCSAMDGDQLTTSLTGTGAARVLHKTDGFFIDLVEAVADQLRAVPPIRQIASLN